MNRSVQLERVSQQMKLRLVTVADGTGGNKVAMSPSWGGHHIQLVMGNENFEYGDSQFESTQGVKFG